MPTKKHKRPEVDLQSLDLRTPEPSEQRAVPSNQRGFKPGLLPRQEIRKLVERGIVHVADPKGVWATPIEESQFQPASLDLRLGSRAYRVRASFLPGRGKTVQQQLDELSSHELSLVDGAVLERGCVYVVELLEHINGLPEILAAVANPKSSTGRLDVFTRLITDHSEIFDNVVSGYSGPLFAEISPSTFSIK